MKKIIVTLLVVVLLLGSIPSAFAADKEVNYELNTYICISNLSTQKSVQLLELDTRPNALFMKAQDAAKFSGFKVSENGGSVTYTRSTDSVTITDTISYLGVTWVPCESTLEKLQTSIREVSEGLVITGKETTPAELYELVRTKVFGTQNGTFTGFGIEDRIGGLDDFTVKASIFSASIHSSLLEWKWFENGIQAIQELVSKESFTSKYESIIHEVLEPEEYLEEITSSFSQSKAKFKELKSVSSNLKTVVDGSFILAFSKYIDWSKFDSLSDAQEYSGIYADIAKMIKNNSGDIDKMLESKEYLEYASNYSIADLSGQAQYSEVLGKMNSAFEIPKGVKSFSKGLGYFTDPAGTILKDITGVKLKGLDFATQLTLVGNIADILCASDSTKNQIKFTYMDDNGNVTYAGVQQRLALEKFKMYCNSDSNVDRLRSIMIDEAATISYKTIMGVAEDKIEDGLVGWSTAAVCKLCTTLYKATLGESTGANDFFGWAADLIPMIDVQNDAKGRCYTSLINEDALRVKYTAMLYLNMYLINYAKEVKGQMDSETISVTKANDLYTVLAMIKDSDLVGVVKNSPLRKSDIMSCKKECACIVSSDPSLFENDKDVTGNNANDTFTYYMYGRKQIGNTNDNLFILEDGSDLSNKYDLSDYVLYTTYKCEDGNIVECIMYCYDENFIREDKYTMTYTAQYDNQNRITECKYGYKDGMFYFDELYEYSGEGVIGKEYVVQQGRTYLSEETIYKYVKAPRVTKDNLQDFLLDVYEIRKTTYNPDGSIESVYN